MLPRLMKMKIPILLGMITAIALCATSTLTLPNQTIDNIMSWTTVSIPIVLILVAIYKFKTTRNSTLLTYAVSVGTFCILIPIVFLIGLFLVVLITGTMPTPT
jgi:hypothetical protein